MSSMEERPKNRPSLKLGQRKLSFQQQKGQTVSKTQDGNSRTTQPESTPPLSNSISSDIASTRDEQGKSVTVTTDREVPPLSGLCNLGNTCYINSLLQTLRFCPQFSEWIGELHSLCERIASSQPSKSTSANSRKKETHSNGVSVDVAGYLSLDTRLMADGDGMECSEPQREGASDEQSPSIGLATHLHALWQRMDQKERTFVRPTNKVTFLTATKPDSFIAKLKEENPVFNNKQQQDAQEMLRFTLTSLHETFITATKSSFCGLHPNGPLESDTTSEVIDVDSYSSKTSQQAPGVRSRKRKLSYPENSVKMASKVIKLNKSVSRKNKKVTEYFKLKDSQDREEQMAAKKMLTVNETSSTSVRDFITDSFQGQLAYQMRCYECDSYTRRTEPFLDVSVPVTSSADILPGFPCEASPHKPTNSGGSYLLSNADIGPHSLSWALSQFAMREKLRGNNKYFCDECGHFVEAERSVLFSHLSSIMTIHLNRFSAQMWGLSSTVTVNKVGGNLAIPLSLSFKPWCTDDCNGRDRVYQLFAVVFHSGSSCSSGHYTTCVRGRECGQVSSGEINSNRWIYFDDDQLDFISQSELLEMMSPLSNNASTVYILFYRCNS